MAARRNVITSRRGSVWDGGASQDAQVSCFVPPWPMEVGFPALRGPKAVMVNVVWTDDVQEKLAQLRAADPAFKLFGASSHEYRPRPPLTEFEAQEFERRFEFRLPGEYREFLLRVGDGGAGPGYGVFRLGYHTNENNEWVPWQPGRDVGTPSKAFPYTAPWNLPQGFWPEDDDAATATEVAIEAAARELQRLGIDLRRDRIGRETWRNPFTGATLPVSLGLVVQEGYFARELLNGSIPLCSDGCNLSSWLVVTGPERAHVWRDLRAEYQGIVPAQSRSRTGLTFRQWYEAWLDGMLTEAVNK